MSDAAGSNQWLKQWQALQQQFVSAWKDAAGGSGKAGIAGMAGVPLHEGFDLWANLFQRNAGEGQSELVDRVLGSARQFVSLMQGALSQLAGQQGSDTASWRKSVEQALGGLGLERNPVFDAMRLAVGQGSKGFEQMFGDFGRFAEPMRREFGTLLASPAFGYNREQQERHQALAAAQLDYAQQLERYHALMLEASKRGLERFESKLGERSEPGREIKSFREFYDVFIDAAEEGYAEVALSDDFRHAYGALVNAQMRVRQLVQKEIELATGALGMPGRTEVNGVHQKLTELRRRVATLEADLQQAHSSRTSATKTTVSNEAHDVAQPVPAPVRRKPASGRAGGKKSAPAMQGSRSAAGKRKERKTTARAAKPAPLGAATQPIDFAARLAAARSRRTPRRGETSKGGR
jgi:class III poly(R)-hydroxyalkanoic acid synthase PhaE subunit